MIDTRRRLASLVLLALLLPDALPAQEAGRVIAMTSPAWIESSRGVRPLTPALALRDGDRLRTGLGGRLRLSLADGSEVKLGENADFQLQQMRASAAQPGLFQGVLNVLQGAFRYTTTLLGRDRRRDLNIRVAGITAGIRGTDVWGRADAERDIFCLIEGAVEVRRGDESPIAMNQPLTFYVAPRDGPSLPVAPVDAQQLAKWAAAVELDPAAGVLSAESGHGVVLESDRLPGNAQATAQRLQRLGYPAQVEQARVRRQLRHRVVVRGFAGIDAASAFARRMVRSEGIPGAFVVLPPG